MQRFSANAKFLITGEYAVLDNVPALAVPLKLQQHLEVIENNSGKLSWKSYDVDEFKWFELETTTEDVLSAKTYEDPIAQKLTAILKSALEASSNFDQNKGYEVKTTLDFDRTYGMGTSSTLISLIAQWTGCDPYALQFEHFGGSGYDIACATADTPILYDYNNGKPIVTPARFNPNFKEHIYFVYLNQKQNSRNSIASFDREKLTIAVRERLSKMPELFQKAAKTSLSDFQKLMEEHETIISKLVNLPPVKERLFPDFPGSIKSLGGWGGDFVMVVAKDDPRGYFQSKGYDVIYEWAELMDF